MTPACPRFAKLKQSAEHSSFSFPAISDVADCRVGSSRARAFRRAICVAAILALMAGNTVDAEPVGNPAAQVTPAPIAATVTEAAQRSGIPASWIRAVMQAESGGDARAVSPKGAMGLMQIMPETWASLRLPASSKGGKSAMDYRAFQMRDNSCSPASSVELSRI